MSSCELVALCPEDGVETREARRLAEASIGFIQGVFGILGRPGAVEAKVFFGFPRSPCLTPRSLCLETPSLQPSPVHLVQTRKRWEPTIRGPHIDSRQAGSYHYEKTHKRDPQSLETAR